VVVFRSFDLLRNRFFGKFGEGEFEIRWTPYTAVLQTVYLAAL
jgi:hypothetical protein